MSPLPIGIQSIHKILQQGYLYVDKTQFAYNLIHSGTPHYFLSRPRRFGKSLFLSTLAAILQGEKDLFAGCAIAQSNYDWKRYPTILLDFYALDTRNAMAFEASAKRHLKSRAQRQGVTIETPTAAEGLESLVLQTFYKNNQTPVVVLIDEYDKPIIHNLCKPEEVEPLRELLSDFFGILKSLDHYLKFTFITGVSKFSKVSLFSGPNNLKDITMHPRYAAITGYTEQELTQVFDEYIQDIAQNRGMTKGEVLTEIKRWYNGYRFSEEEIYVYNPFSTLNFMDERQPQSYWYSSGTPSFLIKQLQKHPETLVPLTGATARKSELTDISGLETLDLKALMFQTGYLTITGYHERAQQYTLSFPNQEVQEAFMDSLVSHFAPHNTRIRNACYEALVQCEPTAFFAQVQTDIAAFPNLFFSRAQESTYHMVLLGLMRGMGLTVTAEVLTHLGRLDLVVDMPHIIYILELKLDKSPQEALDQMQQKHYCQPYLRQDKQVGLLGVQFSSQVRNLTGWLGMLLDAEGNLIRYLQPSPTDISKKHI
ncbi:MAG: AAA family ATPase [Bacteroidota bacterium]